MRRFFVKSARWGGKNYCFLYFASQNGLFNFKWFSLSGNLHNSICGNKFWKRYKLSDGLKSFERPRFQLFRLISLTTDLDVCSDGDNKFTTPTQITARFNSPVTAHLLILHGAVVAKQSNYGRQAFTMLQDEETWKSFRWVIRDPCQLPPFAMPSTLSRILLGEAKSYYFTISCVPENVK